MKTSVTLTLPEARAVATVNAPQGCCAAEIELREVAVRMALAKVLVDATHPSLGASALWFTRSCPANRLPMRG